MHARGSSFFFFSSFLVSNRRPRNSILAEHVAPARSPKNFFSPQVCLSHRGGVYVCVCPCICMSTLHRFRASNTSTSTWLDSRSVLMEIPVSFSAERGRARSPGRSLVELKNNYTYTPSYTFLVFPNDSEIALMTHLMAEFRKRTCLDWNFSFLPFRTS